MMICCPSRAATWTIGTPLLLQTSVSHYIALQVDSGTTELCASQMAVSKQFESPFVPSLSSCSAQQSVIYSLLRK